MITVKEYVESLDDCTKVKIINDFNNFESKGSIGESVIRLHVNNLMLKLSMQEDHVVFLMQQLAFECFRYFANLWITIDDE